MSNSGKLIQVDWREGTKILLKMTATIIKCTILGIGTGAFFGSIVGGGIGTALQMIPLIIKQGLPSLQNPPFDQFNALGAKAFAGWIAGEHVGIIVVGLAGMAFGLIRACRPKPLSKSTKPVECKT